MTERTEAVATSPTPYLRRFEPGQGANGKGEEKNLISELKAGDEAAFEALLDRLSPSMLRLAGSILSDRTMAEEVVQETWLAVIQGLERFESRSSLKTWIFSILTNLARTRAKRERRTIAFSSLSEIEGPADKLAAAAERFSDHRHAWMSPPRRRKQTPEDRLLSRETVALIRRALRSMPSRQAEVVILRDIEGWSAEEVCQALGLTEVNQKVLLHRGRIKVRNALQRYRDTGDAGGPEKRLVASARSRLPREPRDAGVGSASAARRIAMETLRVVVLAILLPLLQAADLPAKTRDKQFDRISIEQGLSQSSVLCLLQDSRGFMWFGTEDGLNKYDGYDFAVYRHDPQDPQSVSHNNVQSIYEDRSRTLWIGTWGGGLNRFDREKETFAHFQHDPDDARSLSDNTVWSIYEDQSGTLWIGTDTGLNRFDRQKETFLRYQHDPNNLRTLSHDTVRSIYEDEFGALWIGTDGGLNRFDRKKETFVHFQHDPGNARSLGHNGVRSIYEDGSGALWIGTYGGGLNRFDREKGIFTRYKHDPDNARSLSHDRVLSIYEDRSGVLWVGTSGGGLSQFDRERETFTHYQHDLNNPRSLSHNTVNSIYEDRSGVLWIGTYGRGLNRFDRGLQMFAHYQHDPSDPRSLSDNPVLSIHEDRSGVVWIGTWAGGLNRFDREQETFTHYQHDRDNPRSLSHNRVLSIHQDRSGALWVGTSGGGLNRFDRARGTFTHYQHDPNDPRSLSDNSVRTIYEDRSGVLWIGTRVGLDQFDRAKETFAHYQHDPNEPQSLSDNSVRTIYEDRSGVLWIGTENGLNRFDRESKAFRHYRNDPNNPRSLSDSFVWSIYEDRSGVLWIGTQGGGLSRMNRDDRGRATFKHYREKDGLPNDVIYGILEDDEGFIWLSTNKGLARLDRENEWFTNYDVNDGLQSNEFNGGAYFKSTSGEVLFGGINGFNVFFPDRLRHDSIAPPIAITDFRIFNEPVGIADRPHQGRRRTYTLQQHITETNEIVLSYQESVFSFEFAALHYSRPKKNRYAYKMEGFDEVWVESGPRRFATYTNLDPGNYVFRVMASNGGGVWSEKAAIDITIAPPVWKTWWFRAIAGASILVLGFGWYKRRIKNIEVQKEQLEIQVKEKTREIRETQDQLVRSEKLAALGRLTAGIAHEINTPIGAIKSNADIAARCVAKLEEIWGKDNKREEANGYQRFLDALKENTRVSLSASARIAGIVNNLKTFTRLDEAEFVKVDIHEGLDSAEALIRHEIEDGIDVVKEYGEIPEIYCYASELNQVFMTLLRSAVESIEDEGRITIRTFVDDDKLRVEISDSGRGIPVEQLSTLFDFNLRTKGATVGMGMDLVSAYNIVQKHCGEVKTQTEVGRGSTFTIVLPTDLEKRLSTCKPSPSREAKRGSRASGQIDRGSTALDARSFDGERGQSSIH